MKKALYRLYDVYEDRERLLETDSMTEIKKVCKQRDLDTDSEWQPLLYRFDGELGKYKIFEDWSY